MSNNLNNTNTREPNKHDGFILKDIIGKKDYDYVECRAILPVSKKTIFIGCFKTEKGKIISLDGDSYSENQKIVRYEEWNNPKENIVNGLTIYENMNFYGPIDL